MNPTLLTTLKVTAAVVLLLVICHFWPTIAGIGLAGLFIILTLGGTLAVGATVVLAAAAALALALICGVVTVGVALAPLWLPVLAVIGLIAIIRSLSRPAA